MRCCVLCKRNEAFNQKSDNTTLLSFKGEISELLFFSWKILGREVAKQRPPSQDRFGGGELSPNAFASSSGDALVAMGTVLLGDHSETGRT